MLVLSRRPGQTIRLRKDGEEDIVILLVRNPTDSSTAKIGIEAAPTWGIVRDELIQKVGAVTDASL